MPVIRGAEKLLVSERYKRDKYFTNRDIKYWSSFFLLKALTSSGEIQRWRSQKNFLLAWLQLKSEGTLYNHLRELKAKGLITIDKQYTINLVSYKTAAEIMGLLYEGLNQIPYNPLKNEGTQVFQYLIRTEEFRYQKRRQLDALLYYLDKNLPLRNILLLRLVKAGADQQRLLKDRIYLQERLLELQKSAFRHGSDILEEVFARRADINRGLASIKRHHDYLSKASVSYLKRRLFNLKLITLKKICVESKERSRIYVPDPSQDKGRRDGYKWLQRKKQTAWFLTDQINPTYELLPTKHEPRAEKKAA